MLHILGVKSVADHVYIMVPPKNTTVGEKNKVKLACQAEGYPNNITYRWYKNDVDITMVRNTWALLFSYVWHWPC